MNLSISKRQWNEVFYQKVSHRRLSNETTEHSVKNNTKMDYEFTGNSSPKIWGYRS